MAKQIPLSQGKFALVDDEDFERINQWKWSALKDKRFKWYAVRNSPRQLGRRKKLIYMHRVIMNTPEDMDTDHVDGNDTLNNQRHNLRICTHSQNMANSGKRSNNKSGYKGVFMYKGVWCAKLKKDGRVVFDKTFHTAEEAARAYDHAAREHFGGFAYTNFPD